MERAKSQISATELLGKRERLPLMAIFQAFFDESGKFKDKKIVSFCGFCSPPHKIRAFEDEWRSLLRHYGLRALSMKVAVRRNIPLSPTVRANDRDERNAIFIRFADCIKQHFELAVALTVDVGEYKQWSPKAKKRVGG